MPRIVATIVACCFSLAAFAADSTPPLAETYLHQGKFAAGETALLLALDANSNDDEARFGLGIIQFFRAIENLGQALHEYGAISENTSLPFLRLPVPRNERPAAISYRAWGRVLDAFSADLSRAEATLAAVKTEDVKLRLRLANIQFDFAGDGKSRTPLIEVLKKLNNGRPFDFQNRNPDFRIHFDRGDVAWLRAYCHVLGAMVNFYRSVDEEFGFERRMRGIFPRIEGTVDQIEPDWQNGLTIKDVSRLRRARLHLLAVCELNHETWKYIRSEEDNDYEWLSNSKQTEQLGLPITDQQIDAWLSMVKELDQLLQGKSLFPGELLAWFGASQDYQGRGLNVQKLFDDPPTDLFNMTRIREKGIDAKYMESTKDKKPLNVAMLFQSFQFFDGPFGFARAARLN
jgi:hypothetical protein